MGATRARGRSSARFAPHGASELKFAIFAVFTIDFFGFAPHGASELKCYFEFTFVNDDKVRPTRGE